MANSGQMVQSFGSTTSATAQALQTTELLEMIITRLPTTAIYTQQSVCRHWLAVIQESTSIQKAMFRMPSGPPVDPKVVKKMYMPIPPTPAPQALAPTRRGQWTCATYENELEFVVSRSLLPIAQQGKPDVPVTVCYYMGLGWRPMQLDETQYTFFDVSITQPPCTTAFLDVRSDVNVDLNLCCSVRDLEGLTAGFIGNTAQEMIQGMEGFEDADKAVVRLMLCMPVSEQTHKTWEQEWQANEEKRKMKEVESSLEEAAAPGNP